MTEPAQPDLLHSAMRVSAIGAVWTLAASAAAIVIGLLGDSIALVAFGVVGILDCTASVALVAHFRDAKTGGTAEHLERIALRIVTIGLVTVGLATGVVSTMHLVDRQETDGSLRNVVLAGASLVALSVLSARKHHIAVRLPSHALLADSRLSAVGAVLAAVTLGGTAAASSLGWWWADPVAALAIAIAAIGMGIALRRES
jgi:divalent metal cation (Fe/Co/Zn/Cd) transporter